MATLRPCSAALRKGKVSRKPRGTRCIWLGEGRGATAPLAAPLRA
jgi:hypothetical protein